MQCSLTWIWEVYTRFDTKLFWHKWKSILIHIWSQFDRDWSCFIAKVNYKKYPSESLLIFASRMTAIDQKNVIPEREKLRLSGGLIAFSACWICLTSSLKPAWFEGKSDEAHSGTNRSVSLGNSERGNSIIISGCQVPYSFVSNSDFSLHWINFRWALNRLGIVVKRLVSRQLRIESTGHCLRWPTNS